MTGFTATVRHASNGITYMVTGVSRADAVARAVEHLPHEDSARLHAVLQDTGVVTVGKLTARVVPIERA